VRKSGISQAEKPVFVVLIVRYLPHDGISISFHHELRAGTELPDRWFIGCQFPAVYDDMAIGRGKISYRTPRTDLEANKRGYDRSQPIYHS
jgi:hypothetical protein